MEIPEKVNLSSVVSDRIKGYILEHDLKAGDKLPSEKQMIDSLGVSRTVVREALKSLEMIGMLKIKTGDGIYVDSLSLKPVLDSVTFRWKQDAKKMRELFATRRVLEMGAVEMAIEHYDLTLIQQMEFWNQEMDAAINRSQIPVEEDLQFHRALFQATGNETFYELSEILNDFFTNIRQRQFGKIDDRKISYREHARIIQLIRDKKVTEAKAEMELHLAPIKKYLLPNMGSSST